MILASFALVGSVPQTGIGAVPAFSYAHVARYDDVQFFNGLATRITASISYGNGQVALCLTPAEGEGKPVVFGGFIGISDATPGGSGTGRQALVKLDADGHVIHSAMIGSSFGTSIGHMQADGRGNVFLLGQTSFGTARFGSLTTDAGTFLARRTGKGDFSLLRTLPIRDHVLAVDGPGNMYVTADTGAAVALDGHELPPLRTHFLKFTSEGRVAWVASRTDLDPGVDQPPDLPHIPSMFVSDAIVDAAGHPVFAGSFEKPLQFGPTALTNGGAFVVKLDPHDGRFLWAKSLGYAQLPRGQSIGVGTLHPTPDGGLLLAGSAGVVGNPTIGPVTIRQGRGNPVGFLARLDAQGQFTWVNLLDRPSPANVGTAGVNAIALGASGTIYVAGGYLCGARLGAIPLGENCVSFTDANGFVAALSPEGQWLWAKTFGGSKQELVTHLGVDAAENLYITGTTESRDARFDSFTVSATGSSSAFLAKLSSGRSAVVNPERTLEGDLRFQVLGTAGLTNRVESSTNLVTWTLFTEFVAQRASTTVLVPASSSGPARYYRAFAK